MASRVVTGPHGHEPPVEHGHGAAATIAQRADAVRARIVAAGGDPDAVTLVAVTKAQDAELARAAVAAGLVDLGENYAQELLAKVEAFATSPVVSPPRWHFIGRLQTNKVRLLAPHVALWQTLDRLTVAREIAKRAPGAAVLVQVNLSGEEQKGGCAFAEAPGLVAGAADLGLEVRGLMGVAPAGDPEAARPGFRRLVGLADTLGLGIRSIGMSADLEVAVQEGSTMVRIGRDLLGERDRTRVPGFPDGAHQPRETEPAMPGED